MNNSKTYKILTVLLIMQWAFYEHLALYPNFIEQFYTNGVYLFISKLLRVIFGWIPFSIGDVIYILLVFISIRFLYVIIKTKSYFKSITFYKIGALLSVIYFLFHLNWGLNYLRPPLHKRLHLSKTSYSENELENFTKKMVTISNAIHNDLVENDSLKVHFKLTKDAIRVLAPTNFLKLSKIVPKYSYNTTSVKSSIFSLPLTYMGFAGYLNPLTNEAQVNSLIPVSTYPATVSHEIAHQLGIASESEANFIGYLAAINSDNLYFKYSGYVMALRYCLYDLYNKNPDSYKSLLPTINKGILKDLEENRKFWLSYQNWSEKYFKAFYDSYLKANKQQQGIKSYNQVVGLLINSEQSLSFLYNE